MDMERSFGRVKGSGTSPRLGYSNSASPRTLTIPTVERLLHASSDGSRSLGQKSPTYCRERDPEDYIGQDYQSKSVLAKVKDKARRWKQNLGKKKGLDNEIGTGTASGGVVLEEEEEDAEYLGAPMYESVLAPEDCKEHARQHPRANPVISENHILPNSPRQGDPRDTNVFTHPTKTMAASKSVPTRNTTSMMQGLTIRPRQGAASSDRGDARAVRHYPGSPAGNTWGKGVSVRENTKPISPRKAGAIANHPHEVGIVEKVKDAVSSLLYTVDSSSASPSNAYPASRRAQVSNTTPEVMEEENHGRILQPN